MRNVERYINVYLNAKNIFISECVRPIDFPISFSSSNAYLFMSCLYVYSLRKNIVHVIYGLSLGLHSNDFLQ